MESGTGCKAITSTCLDSVVFFATCCCKELTLPIKALLRLVNRDIGAVVVLRLANECVRQQTRAEMRRQRVLGNLILQLQCAVSVLPDGAVSPSQAELSCVQREG